MARGKDSSGLEQLGKSLDKNIESALKTQEILAKGIPEATKKATTAISAAKQEVAEFLKGLSDSQRDFLTLANNIGLIGKASSTALPKLEALVQLQSEWVNDERGKGLSEEQLLKKYGVKAMEEAVKEAKVLNNEQDKLAAAQKKSTRQTKESIAANEQLEKSLGKVVETMKTLRKQMGEGGIRVRINNEGFTNVLNEMSKAVENFHRRKGNSGKNFFEAFTGTREENSEKSEQVLTEAKKLTTRLEQALGEGLSESLEQRLQKAISSGIMKGVELGIDHVNSLDPTAKMLANIWSEGNFSQPSKVRSALSLMGKTDLTAVQLEETKQRYLTKRENVKNRANARAAADAARSTREAELAYADANPNSNIGRKMAAEAKRAEADANRATKAYDDMLNKEKQAEVNRQRNAREQMRIEREMAEVYGEEGTKLNELGKKLVLLNADLRQYKTQGEELNKINYAQVARKTEQIRKATREWATELYKTENGYYKVEKAAKFVVERMKEISAMFQTTSATLSSAAGIWSTLRSKATQFFTFFTNGFRRAFSYARNLAQGLFNEGLEQREKIQQAQIGFSAFFGKDRVQSVTSAVRSEAAKTPIVNAGDLADYVMQLAPVSGGNASLALNSSLGILKSLVYSGSDISEGEYVIKNIRDVIAKGTATAIDIRQFNRALPGLETAIKQMPDLADFVDENGKLSITKANVGKVLDVFAKLNTDENSPLKEVEEAQLKTLAGMKQLFEEKKTTAMENILEKAGVFDLLYQVLGIATNDGMWTKVVDFVSKTLQPLVSKLSDLLTGTDWEGVGKKLSEYWGIIKQGVSEAKSIVAETGANILGGASADDVFKRIANIISRFIKGFGEGVSEAMKFAQWLADKVSGGDLEGLAEMVGKYLVSPIGKIVQTLLGLGANSFGAASRALSTMAKVIDAAKKFTLWVKGNEANAMASMYLRNGTNIETASYMSNLSALYKRSPVLAGQMLSNTNLGTVPGSNALSTFSGENGTTIRVFQQQSKLATMAGKAGDALKLFGSRLMSGLAAGGVVYTIGTVAKELVTSLGLFGDKTEQVASAMDVAVAALTGAAVGGAIGKAAGGFVGAVIGAGIALNNLAVEADKARVAEEKKRLAEMLSGGRKELADSIVKAIQEAGIDQFDIGSEEGKYAYNELLEYLNEFDDLGMVDMAKAEEKLLSALRDKTIAQQLYDYSNSSEYNNLGGRVLDLDKDRDYRDRMSKFITDNLLLGTDYDYQNTAAERIVKDWLNGDQLTDKQVDALTGKYEELKTTIGDKTTGLLGTIDNTSQTIQDAEAAIDANTTEMDRLRQSYERGNGLEAFIKDNLLDYDNVVSKGLYTSGDKTWGIGDIFDFINQKIETAGATEEGKEWARLGSDLLAGYNNGDMTTSQIFRYMMKKYGDQGFQDFFNSHGISSTKDENGNETRSSVENYMDAIRDTDFTKRTVRQFELLILSNFAKEFSVNDPGLDSQVISDLEHGLLDEQQKKDLIDKYKEIGEKAFEEYKKEHAKAAAEANEYYGESSPYAGKKRVKNFWWDALGIFGYHPENHGGFIKPIYRATGGELGVDTVPAMLQPGEFVMRRASVSKAGLSTMLALNRGDMASAARSLGARFSGNYNNSRNWSNTINNNQRTQTNYIKVTNRNTSSRMNSYYGLANRIALA